MAGNPLMPRRFQQCKTPRRGGGMPSANRFYPLHPALAVIAGPRPRKSVIGHNERGPYVRLNTLKGLINGRVRPGRDTGLMRLQRYVLLLCCLLASPAHARDMLPPGFVYLRDVDPSIMQDMR